jgi:hypothetical protein
MGARSQVPVLSCSHKPCVTVHLQAQREYAEATMQNCIR